MLELLRKIAKHNRIIYEYVTNSSRWRLFGCISIVLNFALLCIIRLTFISTQQRQWRFSKLFRIANPVVWRFYPIIVFLKPLSYINIKSIVHLITLICNINKFPSWYFEILEHKAHTFLIFILLVGNTLWEVYSIIHCCKN